MWNVFQESVFENMIYSSPTPHNKDERQKKLSKVMSAKFSAGIIEEEENKIINKYFKMFYEQIVKTCIKNVQNSTEIKIHVLKS